MPRPPRCETTQDEGASANTLPLRTVKQMYGAGWMNQTKTADVNLTAYNGSEIKCLGSLTLMCRYEESQWSKEMFYVVDVPSRACNSRPTHLPETTNGHYPYHLSTGTSICAT